MRVSLMQTQTPRRDGGKLRRGAYLTDGNALFNVIGELPDEPALRLLEDCRTFEVLVVHVNDLRSPSVREVRPRASS
jgi:hypothetical protein